MTTPFSDTIPQGADYDLTIYDRAEDKITPTDITGCTARLQARRSFADATADIDLTSEPPAGLTITGNAGQIDVHLTASQTTAMSGTYVVQLELYWPSGRVDRLLDGTWTVAREVIR